MPTQEQIEVGCDIVREELKLVTIMGVSIGSNATDAQIRDIVTKVLTGAENVLGESEK